MTVSSALKRKKISYSSETVGSGGARCVKKLALQRDEEKQFKVARCRAESVTADDEW